MQDEDSYFERIAVLLVHGIGDQARHEHLQSMAKHFVDIFANMHGEANVSVEMFPGAEGMNTPLSILLGRDDGKQTCIDFHECWWRDLGDQQKVSRVLAFWAWALSLFGTPGAFHADTASLFHPAREGKQRVRVGIVGRVELFFKTTYFFLLLYPMWLVTKVVSIIPGLGNIRFFRAVFAYLSSVKLYQEWPAKFRGTLVDFDQPRRISIARRVVTSMQQVATQGYDRWYVMAHSLGSVIAYKALTTNGNALACLLTKNQWENDRTEDLKTTVVLTDGDLAHPEQPKTPMWLGREDAIDRKRLFAHFRGFITWGSPLETFAQTWPAIMPVISEDPFSEAFEWLNFYDPVDVVASPLCSFSTRAQTLSPNKLRPKNIPCRSSLSIASAHTAYFRHRNRKDAKSRIGASVAAWIQSPEQSFEETCSNLQFKPLKRRIVYARKILLLIQALVILLFGLWIWPKAIFLVLTGALQLPRLLFILSPDIESQYQDFMRPFLEQLADPRAGLNALGAVEIVGGTALLLLVLGLVHYLLAKRLRATEIGKEETIVLGKSG